MCIENLGDKFLLNNTLVSQYTKHIDMCHHFMKNYVEGVTLKNIFLHSEENITDTIAKNLSK